MMRNSARQIDMEYNPHDAEHIPHDAEHIPHDAELRILRNLYIGFSVPESFYYIWVWRPPWSCDLNHFLHLYKCLTQHSLVPIGLTAYQLLASSKNTT